jgi:hypothetical protein
MADKSSKMDWGKIIMAIVIAAFGIFGLASFLRANAEEAKRIEAQNETARISTVIQEKEDLWSRLSQQKDDLASVLRQSNSDLASRLEDQGAAIVSLSETIANFKPVRVIVRTENVSQDPVDPTEPGGEQRIRVSFHEEVDPIRVEGFTLSNPPEAEVTVGFTRPLKLRTVITQERNGAWRTYVQGDWPNLTIEQIETVVNPQAARSRSVVENIIVGGNLHTSWQLDSAVGEVFALYSFKDSFAAGPSVGVGIINGESDLLLGAQFQWHPWRR